MAKVVVRHVEVSLEGLPLGADGLRLIHLSDLHLSRWGRREREVQRLLTVLEYDFLLITGDFCDRPNKHARAAELTAKLLDPVKPRHGTFAVLGNHDLPCFTAHDMPMQFLRNENTRIHLGRNNSLCLVGIEQSHHR
ncbi:MAG: metallophosphoesterase, partial [Planctomycetes bacterium]|nr:metallophosphoesterase [Planctomycetota bacterium]